MESATHRRDEPSGTTSDDRYLDAARDAILDVGWSRTTLTDVARRSGVSRMTLYRRWPDHRSLLADLLTREWRRAVGAALATTHRRPEGLARLADEAVAVAAAVREEPLLRRVVDLDPDQLLPYLLHRRGRTRELLLDLLTDRIAEGQRAGWVRDGDPTGLAAALLLAGQGFALSAGTLAAELPDRDSLDRQLHALVCGFLSPDGAR